MITINDSSKLEGSTNYVVWKFEIKTTLLKKGLWDLVNPKIYQDLGIEIVTMVVNERYPNDRGKQQLKT
jgi:hypothetical protein